MRYLSVIADNFDSVTVETRKSPSSPFVALNGVTNQDVCYFLLFCKIQKQNNISWFTKVQDNKLNTTLPDAVTEIKITLNAGVENIRVDAFGCLPKSKIILLKLIELILLSNTDNTF